MHSLQTSIFQEGELCQHWERCGTSTALFLFKLSFCRTSLCFLPCLHILVQVEAWGMHMCYKDLSYCFKGTGTFSSRTSFRDFLDHFLEPCCFFSFQTEENMPLRVEGTLRTSLSSLGVSLRIYLNLHAKPAPGTEALLSRCRMAKFWASNVVHLRH